MKKQVVTLNINNYQPKITEITYPSIQLWADKIGAEFKIIDKPVFNMPSPTYEKFQLYEMSKGYDWTMFIDSDALIHPDCPDWTECITKEVVLFNGLDMCLNRFRASNYTRRSKLLMGACTWNVIFSDWCRDIWHPMDEITWDEAMANITPTLMENASGVCRKEHLIDDYLVTQNIARYGLKVQTINDLVAQYRQGDNQYYFHLYACSEAFKIDALRKQWDHWMATPDLAGLAAAQQPAKIEQAA